MEVDPEVQMAQARSPSFSRAIKMSRLRINMIEGSASAEAEQPPRSVAGRLLCRPRNSLRRRT